MQKNLNSNLIQFSNHKTNWSWIITIFVISLIIVTYESVSSFNIYIANEKLKLRGKTQLIETRFYETKNLIETKIDLLSLQIKNLKLSKKYKSENLFDVIKKFNDENKFGVTALTAANGIHVCSSQSAHPQISILDRPYFQILKNGESAFVISEPLQSRSLKGLWNLVFAKKQVTDKNEFDGSILVTIKLSQIEELIKEIVDSTQIEFQTLNSKKQISTLYPTKFELLNTSTDLSYINKIKKNEFTYLNDYSFLNKDYSLISATYSEKLQMYLIMSSPYAVFLKKWINKIITYTLFYFISLIVLVWLYIRSKESEQQLSDQRIQLVNSAKLSSLGEMAGSIAHEINNPIAIVQLSAELIHKEVTQLQTKIEQIKIEEADQAKSSCTSSLEKINKQIQKIIQSSQRVDRIIKSMRRISRNTPNELINEVYLNDLVDNVRDISIARFEAKNIQFDIESPAHKIKIKCQEVPVEQVILNLLNNAYDAISESENSWIKINYEIKSHKVRLIVSNSGPQIPESVQVKMMEPFFTTKAPGVGTGLGLAISKKIMQENGGELIFIKEAQTPTFALEFMIVQG